MNIVLQSQRATLQLFKETCEIKQLPLELNDQQLRAFLFTLYNMDFSATTTGCRWRPILDILIHNKIQPIDEIVNIYDFIQEQARLRVDKKLSVLHHLLNQ